MKLYVFQVIFLTFIWKQLATADNRMKYNDVDLTPAPISQRDQKGNVDM